MRGTPTPSALSHGRQTVICWLRRHVTELYAYGDAIPGRRWPYSRGAKRSIGSQKALAGQDSAVLAFHRESPTIVCLGKTRNEITIWDYDRELVLGVMAAPAVHHITAKIVLVGDSGVGKTGLGWRLAHGEYKEHDSTHGQQFWVLDQLKHRRDDGTECEAVLWDLACQPDYRVIHTLFLDDANLALVLFNPVNREESLRGVDYWLRALALNRGRPCRIILVGARVDVGEPTLAREDIEAYCREHNVIGGCVATSAKRGDGLGELIERMNSNIGWNEMPAITTTDTFKRIKDLVLRLKEDSSKTEVFTDPENLRRRLEGIDRSWNFSDAEMMTAVRSLADYGYVRVLRISFGEQRIFLAPYLLNNLAASFVLEARRNPKGLGALDEAFVLNGEYAFPELVGLNVRDRHSLLDSATGMFLEHNTCFREPHGTATYLIFPELINHKKPRIEEPAEPEENMSYKVSGEVTNAYASLVVLLGYTNVFVRTHQWQDQAQYLMGENEVCGFRQSSTGVEGEVEFVLYFGKDVSLRTRDLFRSLFEQFLARKRVEVTRYRPVVCPNHKCGYRFGREEIIRQVKRGRTSMYCIECRKKIDLAGVAEEITRSTGKLDLVEREQATAIMRTRYEMVLVKLKSLIGRNRTKAPICFLSYAWGERALERWVETRLARDIQNAGVEVIFDRWHAEKVGSDIARFVSELGREEVFVVVVGTPLYLEKYENKNPNLGRVVAAEVDLIHQRLIGTQDAKASVLPILLRGDIQESLPPLMRGKVCADFRDERTYFAALFKLIVTLHGLSFDNPAIAQLNRSLQAEQLDS